jgi:hypothetical protein
MREHKLFVTVHIVQHEKIFLEECDIKFWPRDPCPNFVEKKSWIWIYIKMNANHTSWHVPVPYSAQKISNNICEFPKVVKNMKSNLCKQTTLPWPVKNMKAGMGGGGQEDKLITVQCTRAKYFAIWQSFLHEDSTQKQRNKILLC